MGTYYESLREKQLNDKYGITSYEYDLLLKQQNYSCRICKGREIVKRNNKIKKLSVDHNHKTGLVRGLLCHNCNILVGFIENNQASNNLDKLFSEIKSYLSLHVG